MGLCAGIRTGRDK